MTLKRWRLLTGDPPLAQITNSVLARFRDVLSKSRGLQSHKKMSPNTIRSKMVTIQTLLDKAGPPRPRNRDAAGLLERVPYAKPPRKLIVERTTVSMELFRDCYLVSVAESVRCARPFSRRGYAVVDVATFSGVPTA